MIRGINFSEIGIDALKIGQSDNVVFGFKRFNLFVGVNNSGKSRILRSIFMNRSPIFYENDDSIKIYDDELVNQIIDKIQKAESVYQLNGVTLNGYEDIINKLQQVKKSEEPFYIKFQKIYEVVHNFDKLDDANFNIDTSTSGSVSQVMVGV